MKLGLSVLAAISLVAVVLAYAATCFVFLFVFSPGAWLGGSVVSAVARAMDGGSYYEGSGSLLGPNLPYFPLTLFVARALAAMGLPLRSLPPLVGGAASFLLPVASTAWSRSLGAKWLPSLAISFSVYALLFATSGTFEMIAAGAFPDASVALLLIVVCLALGNIERSRDVGWARLVAFGGCLVVAGLSKQVGIAGVIGTFAYLCREKWDPQKSELRRNLFGVVIASGLAVIAIVIALPNCYEVTIGVMSRHETDWSRSSVIWENVLGRQLPAVLLYVVSLPAVLSASPHARLRLLHLHCVVGPVIAVQLLATMKDGGGGEYNSYNMDLVWWLLLPIAAWAWASRLSRTLEAWRVGLIAMVCALGTKAAMDVHGRFWANREGSWAGEAVTAATLRSLGKAGDDVFAPEWAFLAIHDAGFRLATGTCTIWHYAMSNKHSNNPRWIDGVVRAIRERRYALISPQWASLLPDVIASRLSAEIEANYVAAPETDWLVPRPELNASDGEDGR